MPAARDIGRKRNGAAWSARKGRSSSWITKQRRLGIHLRDGFACGYCGRDLHGVRPGELTLDHLKPRCKGGSHDSANLITACATCNYGRQDAPWTKFATPGAVERINRLRRRTVNISLAKAILAGEVPHPATNRKEV